METEIPAKKPTRKSIQPRPPAERAVLTAVRDMVRAYTRHHGDLEVDHALMSTNFTISLRVNEDDQGKMVGGGGGNIWALQHLFKVIGLRMGKRLRLTLEKPRRGQQEPLDPFRPNPNFNHGPLAEMLARTLSLMISEPMKLLVADVSDETHFEIVPGAKDLELFRGDTTLAFRNLLTAIGKSNGRRMSFFLSDPDAIEDKPPAPKEEPPAMEIFIDGEAPTAPMDAVEEEAIQRGFQPGDLR